MQILKNLILVILQLLVLNNCLAINRITDKDQKMGTHNLPQFDIEYYHAHVNGHGFSIASSGGCGINYSDDDCYYQTEIIRYHFWRSRSFFRETGHIKEENSTFYNIPVNTWYWYDQNGEVIRTEHYTDSNWVDRLTAKMTNDFSVNLWSKLEAKLAFTNFQGNKVLQVIFHGSGKALEYTVPTQANFAFFKSIDT